MRLPDGGRIDRRSTWTITVDGQTYDAHPGDTVASAMLAGGKIRVGSSLYRDRPRGIFSAGIDEPNALLRVDGGEALVAATVKPVSDALVAHSISGLGVLDPSSDHDTDPVWRDKVFKHCDVLVVGAGPSGLAAALVAGRTGARVILIDTEAELGGSLLSSSSEEIEGMAALDWVGIVGAEFAALPDITVLSGTTAIGSYDANYVIAVERARRLSPAEQVSRPFERLWHVRAKQVVLAAGALERPLVFADNDRPGVMLAGAVRTYLNRYAVNVGQRVVIVTNNNSTESLVADLQARDIDVVVGQPADADVGDIIAVSGGWSPQTHLWTQRSGTTRWNENVAAFVPSGSVEGQQTAGAMNGTFDLDGCLLEGARAGARAATDAGFATTAPSFRGGSDAASPYAIEQRWLLASESEYDVAFVDLQRDQTVADVKQAIGAGLDNVEHVKRYTSVGTGGDQGKTSGVVSAGVVADLLGTSIAELGTSRDRPPYAPVSFATLAGRETGTLLDAERTTPIHAWHVAQGAKFEIVGQWLRPWFYPQGAESMDDAVARECIAARTSVGMQDASTLGKIEIRGKDAGEFLNRVYTNAFKKLPVGSARYGVMCRADGMMWDDGVTMRLAEDRYYMTTTTGNAAAVLDWLEEWLQTEWPDLDVTCTSVTEQWSTIAVVGPRSRAVVAKVAPNLDVSHEAFPFMTFRDTTLTGGVAARVARISFSGELAFEINVSGWHGLAVWEAVYAAGEEFGITPYGTETMHVLRAEKGFVIMGQDTDGTVTPQDAGMDWVVSRAKPFVGSRSHQRADSQREDRKHLVGVLPKERVPEGTQLVVRDVDLSVKPVPMEGFVTSSYYSPTLGRPFGLALVKSGRDRHGEVLLAPVGDKLVEVEICDPVLYDKEGARRDG